MEDGSAEREVKRPLCGGEDIDDPTQDEEQRKLMRARLEAWELPNISDSTQSSASTPAVTPVDPVRTTGQPDGASSGS
eukprot:3775145-Amphidinium_carterae.1